MSRTVPSEVLANDPSCFLSAAATQANGMRLRCKKITIGVREWLQLDTGAVYLL